jgi:hypothetical protein
MVVHPSSIDQLLALPLVPTRLPSGVHALRSGIESIIGPRYRAWIFCLVVWLLCDPCLALLPCPAVVVLAATPPSPTTLEIAVERLLLDYFVV